VSGSNDIKPSEMIEKRITPKKYRYNNRPNHIGNEIVFYVSGIDSAMPCRLFFFFLVDDIVDVCATAVEIVHTTS
jgi:hypothetical protein